MSNEDKAARAGKIEEGLTKEQKVKVACFIAGMRAMAEEQKATGERKAES